MSLFPGFTTRRVRVQGVTINLVTAGEGPARGTGEPRLLHRRVQGIDGLVAKA